MGERAATGLPDPRPRNGHGRAARNVVAESSPKEGLWASGPQRDCRCLAQGDVGSGPGGYWGAEDRGVDGDTETRCGWRAASALH